MFECTEATVVDGLDVRLVTSDCGLRAIDFDLTRPVEGSRYGIHPIATEATRGRYSFRSLPPIDGHERS